MVVVDFVDEDVPDGMKFKLAIRDLGRLFDENHDMTEEEMEEAVQDYYAECYSGWEEITEEKYKEER